MKYNEVQSYVYNLLIKKLDLESNYFQSNADNITFELIGCDMLDQVEIIEDIEKKYKILIDDTQVTYSTSIKDFIELIIKSTKY